MNEGWGFGMKWGERVGEGGREGRLILRSLWNKLELPIIICPTHIFSSSQKELACSRPTPLHQFESPPGKLFGTVAIILENPHPQCNC